MADPLYDLLQPHLPSASQSSPSTSEISNYLSRLVSLRLSDLTTAEPQSLAQSTQSNLILIQALSSRSHRTTTTSSDHLSTLPSSLPLISAAVESIRKAIPDLDASAVSFASSYSKSKDETIGETKGNALLTTRRNAALLARQADKAQDILELPSLLRASIAAANTATSASTGSTSSGANYTQALDLFAHIKRLQILYPNSLLVRSVLADAEIAMKDMTSNLIASLRGQNLRLAAAIRMIGWLRRVAPELSNKTSTNFATAGTAQTPINTLATSTSPFGSPAASTPSQGEGHFGALFLVARLCTFLSMTEALAPLRDLADQETQAHKEGTQNAAASSSKSRPQATRKASGGYNPQIAGQQTERYLKRYIEIFREQSFATISMYRNIFPADEQSIPPTASSSLELGLTLPPALQTFPLYLIDIFMSTLKQYLPNVTDPTTRESLLMQVLYAANSLGRLGADFSLMIAELYDDEGEDEEINDLETVDEAANGPTMPGTAEKEDEDEESKVNGKEDAGGDGDGEAETAENTKAAAAEKQPNPEPEWITVIKKHRVQAARLEALAAGQERVVQRRSSVDVAVR